MTTPPTAGDNPPAEVGNQRAGRHGRSSSPDRGDTLVAGQSVEQNDMDTDR